MSLQGISKDKAFAVHPDGTLKRRSAMNEARREAADKAYMDYDFGDGIEVEDASGWEHTTHGREWTRAVFVASDQGDTCGMASTKLTFTVCFVHGKDEVETCYASDSKGNVWGSHSEKETSHVRLVVSATYGCRKDDLADLKVAIEEELKRAVGAGLLSHGYLTPTEWDVKLLSVSKAEMDLDEEALTAWLSGILESGAIKLEDVPKQLARYALEDPFEMRSAFAERMGLDV